MSATPGDAEPVLLRIESDVAWLTLNRPHRMNAMNLDLVTALADALDRVLDSDQAKALVITGAGRGFCSGEDLKEASDAESAEMMAFVDMLQTATRRLLSLEIPTIAAINGPAIGGGAELALACDWKLASADAIIGFPETSLGVIVTGGGLALIEAHVGLGRAMQLLLGGQLISADAAEGMGLVTELAEAADFASAIEAAAQRLANLPALAVAELKRGLGELHRSTVEHAMEIESGAIGRLYSHPDSKNLANAFKAVKGA